MIGVAAFIISTSYFRCMANMSIRGADHRLEGALIAFSETEKLLEKAKHTMKKAKGRKVAKAKSIVQLNWKTLELKKQKNTHRTMRASSSSRRESAGACNISMSAPAMICTHRTLTQMASDTRCPTTTRVCAHAWWLSRGPATRTLVAPLIARASSSSQIARLRRSSLAKIMVMASAFSRRTGGCLR